MPRRLGRSFPFMLKGKKSVSVIFAFGETVETPTWKKAVQTILKHCNGQPDMHERLMAAARKGVRQVSWQNTRRYFLFIVLVRDNCKERILLL